MSHWDAVAALVADLPTGLVVFDGDRVVQAANAAALAMLDRPPADTVGLGLPEVLGPERAGQVEREGSGRWSALEWAFTPLPGGGGRIVLHDRSVRLAERARLRRQNRALAELMAMKAEFVASVSHELRTPVTSIAALSELLVAEAPEPLAEPLAAIDRNARRLQTLITTITELVQLEADTTPPPGTLVDLTELAREAVGRWQGPVPFRLRAEGPAPVAGDPARLRRLLDAMGGLALATAEPGCPVEVHVSVAAGECLLSVPIGGRGGDRLFTASAAEHDGLRHDSTALMLCRAIVARHRGRFTTRAAGGVTELVAALPIAAQPVAAVPVAAVPAAAVPAAAEAVAALVQDPPASSSAETRSSSTFGSNGFTR